MYTLVYNIQLGVWISLDLAQLYINSKDFLYDFARKGFYPYTYSFTQKVRTDTAQCSYCGKFVLMREMTRDHVWPKSLGGEITTTACSECNTRKRDMKPIEFAIWWSEKGNAFG